MTGFRFPMAVLILLATTVSRLVLGNTQIPNGIISQVKRLELEADYSASSDDTQYTLNVNLTPFIRLRFLVIIQRDIFKCYI